MSDDIKKGPSTEDPMAKARAAKAAKAKAQKGAEPEMALTRRTVTRTEKYLTPTGRDVTKTTEEVFEPKPKAERRKVIYSQTDLDAIEEAQRRKDKSFFGGLTKIVLLIAALVLVVGGVLMFAGSAFNSTDSAANPATATPPAVEQSPDFTPAPTPEAEATPPRVSPPETPAPEADATPTPEATPAPEVPPAMRAEPAPAPTPTPAPTQASSGTALNFIVHPYADRRDDFINYDFDRRRVCWANSSGRAGMPSGCQRYTELEAATKATFDSLCRQHYAFAEVCPADVTIDVVLRELEYHSPDKAS